MSKEMSNREILIAFSILLPYRVLIKVDGVSDPVLLKSVGYDISGSQIYYSWGTKYEDHRNVVFSETPFKIYLRGMDDITDFEREVIDLESSETLSTYMSMRDTDIWKVAPQRELAELKWFLENHIDIFGLIEEGLAVEVKAMSPMNPYKSEDYERMLEKVL
jgi:hypothetical protein